MLQLNFANRIIPIAPDEFETPERRHCVHAIVCLKGPREKNVRFLAPSSAHEFLKDGMCPRGSDEFPDAMILKTGSESVTG